MTTIIEALASLRARLTGGDVKDGANNAVPFRWPNDDGGPLPDTPAAFIYGELLTEPGDVASFGGGRGANTYRTPARFILYVFVPKTTGLDDALSIAEQLAALLRSYRDDKVSCFAATVHPGGDGASLKPEGLDSDVGNYFWSSTEVSLFFDQVG